MSQSSTNNPELPERSQNSSETESNNLVNHDKRSVEGNDNLVVQADDSSVIQLHLSNSNNNQILQINSSQFDLSSILSQLADLKNMQSNQIEYGKTLIHKGDFNLALDYFLNLKEQLSSTSEDNIKYQILAYIGLANYELGNFEEAARYFIQAQKKAKRDNAQALALVALGYESIGDFKNAEKYIQQAIELNPGNSVANGLTIRINSANLSLEELTELVLPLYRNDINVLLSLGVAALDKERFIEAEKYFEKSIDVSDGDTKKIKLFLSCALLQPFTNKVPLFLIGQLDSNKQKKIEKAVELLTDVLDAIIPNPENISNIQLNALVNRSGALWLLDRREEAIRDLEIALSSDIENPQLIRQYADLLYRSGNVEKAIVELKKVAIDLQHPEASIDLARILVEYDSFHEAEILINKIIENKLDYKFKSDAQQIKISLFHKVERFEEAKLLCEQLLKKEPDNTITFTQYIYILKATNCQHTEIEKLINCCRNFINIDSLNLVSLYCLARLYEDFKYYRDAASIYEKLADTTLNNELTERLLYTYYYSGNLKSALSLCKQILDRSDNNLPVAEMTSCIYEDIGDLNKARKVCQSILKHFPNNIPIQLRLAVINRRANNFKDLDSFLDTNISMEDLTLEGCKELVRLYKIRNKFQRAAEIIYETRRRFYNNSWVHAYYFISYIEGISSVPGKFDFSNVINNCGVLLEDKSNKKTWYIFEDRADSDSNKNEINSQHPLYNKLIGKKVGDEIIIRKGYRGKGEIIKTIIAITDKYLAAREQSLEIVDNSDDLEYLLSFKIPNTDEIDDEVFDLWNQTIQDGESHFRKLYAYYSDKKIPFGTLAIGANNQNPINLWLNLVIKKDYSIFCYWNHRENFKSALAHLEKGGMIIVDIISLLTLYHLKIADKVVEALGKFGIPQSTFDLFHQLVHTLQEQACNEYVHIDISMGYPFLNGHFPDEPAQLKAHFEQIAKWIKTNCHILTSDKAIDLGRERKDERDKAIGASFADTLLLASEPNRILLSEDQIIRDAAHSESGTKGVWSQTVLYYCYVRGYIDFSKYFDALLELINWEYSFILIDVNLLLEGARRTNWQVKQPYTTLLEYLANSQATEDFLTFIATNFLYQIYKEDILPHHRDTLIFELLKAITIKTSQRSILEQLIPRIKNKFNLQPVTYNEILCLIKIWQDSQTIRT